MQYLYLILFSYFNLDGYLLVSCIVNMMVSIIMASYAIIGDWQINLFDYSLNCLINYSDFHSYCFLSLNGKATHYSTTPICWSPMPLLFLHYTLCTIKWFHYWYYFIVMFYIFGIVTITKYGFLWKLRWCYLFLELYVFEMWLLCIDHVS